MGYNAQHSKDCIHASSPKSQNLNHEVGIEVYPAILNMVCVLGCPLLLPLSETSISLSMLSFRPSNPTINWCLPEPHIMVSLLSNALISVVAVSNRSLKAEILTLLLSCHLFSIHSLHRNLSPITFSMTLHKTNIIFPLRQSVFYSFLEGLRALASCYCCWIHSHF